MYTEEPLKEKVENRAITGFLYCKDPIELFWKEAEPFCRTKSFICGDTWIKFKPEYCRGTNEYENLVKKAEEILTSKKVAYFPWGLVVSNSTKEETPKSEHEKEYSISQSRAFLGELYSVLLDAKGNIIDGFHRKGEKPKLA